VHGIVVQSGGQIVVESDPARGTVFSVYLPAHTGAVAPRRPTPAAGTPIAAGQVRTVLVVDDDDAVRDVAVRALSRAGYRVIAARSGSAALDLLARQDDRATLLVVTDVLMPGMSGLELADRVGREYPEVRLAFMSGFSTDELARSGLVSPLRSLLNKPFTLPELVGFVEHAFAMEAARAT
jgi:two-component system, cell cycle sensor histidine kinase and response regulator CckA